MGIYKIYNHLAPTGWHRSVERAACGRAAEPHRQQGGGKWQHARAPPNHSNQGQQSRHAAACLHATESRDLSWPQRCALTASQHAGMRHGLAPDLYMHMSDCNYVWVCMDIVVPMALRILSRTNSFSLCGKGGKAAILAKYFRMMQQAPFAKDARLAFCAKPCGK